MRNTGARNYIDDGGSTFKAQAQVNASNEQVNHYN